MVNSVDSQTSAAQQAVFDRLGISTQANEANRATSDTLGQQDFLQLMTAQLQNQDPFAPMENGDFIAQMAQFSTVSGINQLNEGFTTLTDQMRQMRIATASNLLGHSVLVPGNIARADDQGEIHGVIDLPQASSSTRVSFSDAETGELYHTEDLGARGSGLTGFGWINLPQPVIDANRPIKVDVTVNLGDGEQSLGPSVYAEVLSAAASGASSDAVTLDVQDYGEFAVTNVTRFR